VGHFRGPLLAYRLEVEKRRVAFEPSPPGVVFSSRLRTDSAIEPPVEGFLPRARVGRWSVSVRCA
jgi:hypothetical protein